MEATQEREYIRRILDGDTSLYAKLLEAYSGKIHALIVRIASSREEAEELTQDVFIKCFNKLGSFRGDCLFSTWLYRIAYNTAVSATRKKKPTSTVIDEKILHNISDQSVDALLNDDENDELLLQLEQAVNKLPPDEKALVTLYYYADKSVTELSSIMDISPSNVKTKLFRIRKKLYYMIKEEGHGKR
jgi:RNA polymerase sigma-70 factor (ECF subfamily)